MDACSAERIRPCLAKSSPMATYGGSSSAGEGAMGLEVQMLSPGRVIIGERSDTPPLAFLVDWYFRCLTSVLARGQARRRLIPSEQSAPEHNCGASLKTPQLLIQIVPRGGTALSPPDAPSHKRRLSPRCCWTRLLRARRRCAHARDERLRKRQLHLAVARTCACVTQLADV
eukprot:scaffold375_cov378-Prasinococcus_capsulatus_cf.AAC.28